MLRLERAQTEEKALSTLTFYRGTVVTEDAYLDTTETYENLNRIPKTTFHAICK